MNAFWILFVVTQKVSNADGGFECFYHYNGGTGKTLAQNIEAEVKAIGQNSRGCKIRLNSSGTDYYGFVRETACPAVIVEGCFVDNATDVQIAARDRADRFAHKDASILKAFLHAFFIHLNS